MLTTKDMFCMKAYSSLRMGMHENGNAVNIEYLT